MAICGAWSIGTFTGLLLLLAFQSGGSCGSLLPCSLTRNFTKQGLTVTVSLSVLVPLISIVICYIAILVKVQSYLRSDMYKMSKQNTKHIKLTLQKSESKSTTVTEETSKDGSTTPESRDKLTVTATTNRDSQKKVKKKRKHSVTRQLSTLLPVSQESLIKACKTGIFVVAYMCTCFPYYIGCLMYALCSGEDCLQISTFTDIKLSLPGFANSIVNPLLYAWWHKGFRKTIYRIYKKTRS